MLNICIGTRLLTIVLKYTKVTGADVLLTPKTYLSVYFFARIPQKEKNEEKKQCNSDHNLLLYLINEIFAERRQD